ncbi:hypothetical protein Ctha_2599 [Chloroherpeton thalassium ATCC 35110]|uniref:ABM domain-containing protein n=1 Tax=Chloroherpeton thalassium (strain ATCC 35110 / GB-78) TaxID=517418 RepID=B3QY82_CHLT3|nr:antibiotic biosynthesis monooxygenase [Chloroherpeton thalassium]ACF15048.1 hypothetical protein Ctha_2599 [Chloroherpeton thalassium ATCC 35110]
MKFGYVFLLIFFASFVQACAPGHHLAFEQFQSPHSGTVLSVQGYVIKSNSDTAALQQNWMNLAEKMSRKPGFISCHLSPGIGESTLWLAHSKWENLEALRNAFADPIILKLEEKLPNKFEHLFSLGEKGAFDRKRQ